MNNKVVFRTYLIILAIFIAVLSALFIVPFGFSQKLIPIIWSEDTKWYEALGTTLVNLLYGVISSTILALFISLITYQYDILRMESDFLSNINNIDRLCQKAVEKQTVDQLADAIEFQNQRYAFLTTKAYKRYLVRSKKTRDKIETSIHNINNCISQISLCCQNTLSVEKTYNDVHRQCNNLVLKVLVCNCESTDSDENKEKIFELLNQLHGLQESKKQKIEEISEPVNKLEDEYAKLALYLHYRNNL